MDQPNMSEGQIPLIGTSHNNSSGSGDLVRQRNEEIESQSGTQIERKRYQRHTHHQTQTMEAFFKECPNPNDKQRKDLSRQLGLDPLQVKFWFQNKRTQIKSQHERIESQTLKSENDKLRVENNRYKEILSSATCSICLGPVALGDRSAVVQQLRIENARLKEELHMVSAGKYVGNSLLSDPHLSAGGHSHSFDHGNNSGTQLRILGGNTSGVTEVYRCLPRPTDADKPMIVELAVASMSEFMTIAQAGEPLWIPAGDNVTEVLNEDEYLRIFPIRISPKPLGFKSEASRESAVVNMNHINLVEILMDVNQWSTVFCGIISRAMTLEVLLNGVAGDYNGALQVMTAEFQVPSPFVPTRENYFVRYCKQHAYGTWALVDVSLDNICPSQISRSRRRPSGCLIQELSNGYSKVTWIEHVEVDDTNVHDMYRPLVNSGLAFGAKRWVATLDRHCKRLASALASNISAEHLFGVLQNAEGRKNMLKLSERMVKSFYNGVGSSTANSWTTLSATGCDNVRFMTKRSLNDPGAPPGIVLSAATSFWIHVQPKKVFDYLRNEYSRNEWDILSNGSSVHEMARIANGQDPDNSISLLRINKANSSQSNMLILQESYNDPTGSYVVYAPLDNIRMNVILNGGDPDYVSILPSGFAILPDGRRILDGGLGGSLLTLAFQILDDAVPTANISLDSVAPMSTIIMSTFESIKTALNYEIAHDLVA